MQIQWLGHSAFKIAGTNATLLIDPFLTGNPGFTGTVAEVTEGITHVLLTHAHNDHFGDTLDILEKTGATLIAAVEIADFVDSQLEGAATVGMNIGGTVDGDGFTVSMVHAFHSSSYTREDGSVVYGGMPAGLVITIDGHTVYHMGDTGIFSDMALINDLHRPDIGIVPMGGHFTMDARTAALAVDRFFAFKTVIPCHYGTFPALAPNADEFKAEVRSADVRIFAPMETTHL